ncbi:MAG: hypothetical protein L3I99_02605 [Sulfurimonas sp.]|nr:hypothetical protein [Sulfurimonas sp.]
MSDGFEKLKEIGAQKIHEQTHIPKEHAHSIINKKFTKMNKIQYLGFISILEREYSIKLDSLKNSAKEYFQESEKDNKTTTEKLFVVPQRKKSYTKHYILLAVLILVAVAIFNTSTQEQSINTPSVDLKITEQPISTPSIDLKTTEQLIDTPSPKPKTTTQIIQTAKKTVAKEKESEPIVKEEAIPKVFKIIPNVKLWMWYADVNTNKKKQKTFSDEFELDADGHWLLALGHGDVSFMINGKLEEYKIQKNIRFEYKNHKLRKITYSEFLTLNKGKEW